MSDKLGIGSKRLKLFHRVSNRTTPLGGSASTAGSGSSIAAREPRAVPKETHAGRSKWTKLARLSQLLSTSAQAFGPLKSALDMILRGVELFENELRSRGEYRILKVELESLFGDLSEYFAGALSPVMTSVVTKIAQGIQTEMSLVIEKLEARKLMDYLEAVKYDDDVLDCYRRIQSLLRRLALNVDVNILEIIDEHSTDTRIRKLPNSLGATYMSAQSDSLGRGECTPNTRAQVLQNMHDWAYDPEAPWLYWLNGMAGTGKTTIAYSLCARLDRNRKLAASFFCSRQLPECRDVNRIIPSIAYQLSLFSLPFRRALSDLLKEEPEAYNRPLAVQFERLIMDPLEEVAGEFPMDRVVIIDALDECEDKGSVDRLLSVIIENARALPIKFFLTSRPEPKILDRIRSIHSKQLGTELQLHELEQTTVQEDIRTYLNFELRSMNLSRAQIEVLVKQSGVMFIYAATVVRYISSDNFSSSDDRLHEVLRISSTSSTDANREIDALYTTILKSAFEDSSSSSSDRTRMVLLLRTIVCAQEPLTVNAIADLTRLDAGKIVRPRLRPLMSILRISESSGVLMTLHESFSDYLLNVSRSGGFYCDPKSFHVRMAQMCFDMIDQPDPLFNICGLESSCIYDKDVPKLEERVAASISEALCYACRYWGAHVALGEPSLELRNRLEHFLRTRLLLWIEVLNLKKCVSEGARTLYSGSRLMFCSYVAKELMQDALEFITVLSSSDILKSTPHIYLSGLAFWPENKPIWKHYSAHLAGLVTVKGNALTMRGSTLLARIKSESEVLCVSYSPNGAYVASGHSDGTVCIWDAYTSKLVGQPLKGHTDMVSSVAYSPNGSRIISGSDDTSIRIWDAYTGQNLGRSLRGHTDGVLSVAYSPDSARIVSGSWDSTIRVWCAHTNRQIGLPLKGHTGSVQSVIYSPNGTRIISGSSDKTLRIWDAKTGQTIGTPLVGHSNWVRSASYSPDGSRIISGSWDQTIRIWDAYTGCPIGWPIQGYSHVDAVACSPDSKFIVAGLEHGDIYIWDLYTGQRIGRLREKEAYGSIRAIAYSPDGTRIVSSDEESASIFIWNAQGGGNITASREDYVSSISTITYSPDGARIFSGSDEDTTVFIWDTETGQIIGEPLDGHTQAVLSIACSPDGTYIVTGSADHTIIVWDAITGRWIFQPLEGHTDSVLSVAWSPDAARIVSGSSDKTIRQWNMHNGQQAGPPLVGHNEFVRCVTYSPDGFRIASGSGDNTVRIWDSRSGQPIGQPFTGHLDHIYSVAYSPDGTHIVSGSGDKTIRIWDTLNEQQLGLVLEGHTSDVCSAAYTPDGLYIVSGSFDSTVRIWNVQTGEPVGEVLEGHTDSVRSIALSRCGLRIASGSNDGSVRIWDLAQTLAISSSSLNTDSQTLSCGHTNFSMPHSTRLSSAELNNDIEGTSHNKHTKLRDKWTLRSDGWVVNGRCELLFWVPADLHSQIMRPYNILLISPRGWLQLDFDSTRFGERWWEWYQSQNSNSNPKYVTHASYNV